MKRCVFLLPLFIWMGCRKDSGDLLPVGQPAVSSSYSFQALIDSSFFNFSSSDPGYVGQSAAVITGSQPASVMYQSSLSRQSTLSPCLCINVGRLAYTGSAPSDSAFIAFFSPGIHTYSQFAVNGIEINWIDLHNFLWSTSEMNGYQGNHRFNIVQAQPFYANGVCCVRITADFTCTLYNPNAISVELTSGHFEGIIKKQ